MAACTHPFCEEDVKLHFCGRHFARLPDDLRTRISRTPKKDLESLVQLLMEARTYFAERMIGGHEIQTCRGFPPEYDGCGADIVWLPTPSGKNRPANADTVTEDDERFDSQKHTPHSATCTKPRRR